MTSQAAAAFLAAVDQERAAIAQDAAEDTESDVGLVKTTDLFERKIGVLAYTPSMAKIILERHAAQCDGNGCIVEELLHGPFVKVVYTEPGPFGGPMLIERYLDPPAAKLMAAQLWAAAEHAETKP